MPQIAQSHSLETSLDGLQHNPHNFSVLWTENGKDCKAHLGNTQGLGAVHGHLLYKVKVVSVYSSSGPDCSVYCVSVIGIGWAAVMELSKMSLLPKI